VPRSCQTGVLLSWAYVLSGAGLGMSALEMTSMSGDGGMAPMAPMAPMAWDLGYAWLMFLM